jgi:phage shock protein A
MAQDAQRQGCGGLEGGKCFMSDTPMTDGRKYGYSGDGTELVSADFARQLERELNEARQTIANLEASRALANEGAARQAQSRDEWRQCAEGLALAANPLAAIATAWEHDGLDESRPNDWGETRDTASAVVLLLGRGGKTLLTIGDAFLAKETLAECERLKGTK